MAELIIKGTPFYVKMVMVVSVVLVVAGFIIPPTAVIHGSVLKAIGELLGFAMLFDFAQKLPIYIKAGAKAKIQHGNTSIEVGARKKEADGAAVDYNAPTPEDIQPSETEEEDDRTNRQRTRE